MSVIAYASARDTSAFPDIFREYGSEIDLVIHAAAFVRHRLGDHSGRADRAVVVDDDDLVDVRGRRDFSKPPATLQAAPDPVDVAR